MTHLAISERIHSTTFWLGVISTVLSLIVAFGVPLTTAQQHVLLAAAGIIISLILGGSAVSAAHARTVDAAPESANSHAANPTPPASH